jgi:hypothetical protein
MSDQDETARRMAFFEQLAREAAAGVQDECDNPDCACHRDVGERLGDGAAEVTMTEVYEDEPGWDQPGGW